MKNLYSCLILLLLLVSCSPETDLATATTDSDNVPPPIETIQRGVELPANPDNVYDNAGQLHNAIFETYYSGSPLPGSIDSIAVLAESIGSANSPFQALKGSGYVPVSPTRVAYIISHQSTCVDEILTASSLSTESKLSLADFIDDVTALYATEADYETIYNFIVSYETAVIQNSQMTQGDKKIILTTSSIARYTTYMGRKKPKQNADADWTVFITSIAGAVEGASSGTAEAIMMAFVTGVAENNL